MMPTVYEVRYCASTLYAYGIGSAIDAARLLSDEHERAEVYGPGSVLVAIYVRGERACLCTRTGRVRAVWPESPAESVDRVVTAAVARRDATGVSLDTALLVEAVLARDEASER